MRAGVFTIVAGSVRSVVRVDRAQLALVPALRSAVGMAIVLVAGEATGHLLIGVTAGVGALISGIASLQGTYRSRAGVMVISTIGFALSAFVGGTIGHLEGPDILLIALWGFTAGFEVLFGQPSAVVGLLSVIGLVVFAQFSFTPGQAAVEAAFVLAGGILQVFLVVVVWPLRRYPAERQALSVVFAQLAGYARLLATAPATLLDPTVLDDLRETLADPQPLGNPDEAAAYRGLADQAERMRLELAGAARGCQRMGNMGEGAAENLMAIMTASAGILTEVADALRSGRSARPGRVDRDRIRTAVDRLRSDAEGIGNSADRWSRSNPALAGDSADALAGQLRTIVHLTSVAAGDEPAPLSHATPRTPGAAWVRVRVAKGFGAVHDHLEVLRANVTLTSEAFRHALRVAVTLSVAVAVSHLFPLGHGYWLPMTVIIVLKPDFSATFARGVSRSIGTLIGVGLVTLILAGLRPPPDGLVAITIVLYAAAITVLRANYALYSVCIASLVVTLLAFTGEPEMALAADRSFYTVIGAALALAAYAVWPTWEHAVVSERLATLLEKDGMYGGAVLKAWADPGQSDPVALQRARLDARLARSNAEASVDRWLTEPTGATQVSPEVAQGIVAAVRTYVQGTLALHAHLPAAGPSRPYLDRLGAEVNEAMDQVAGALRTGPRTASMPRLRATQVDAATRLSWEPNHNDALGMQSDERDRQAAVVMSETDLMVNAVNTLAHLVGVEHDPGDDPGHDPDTGPGGPRISGE